MSTFINSCNEWGYCFSVWAHGEIISPSSRKFLSYSSVRPSSPFSQSLPSGASRSSYPSPSGGRHTENHNHRKLTNLITWTTALSYSMKLWAMPCRDTQDGWVMVETSENMWSTGKSNGKPLQYLCLENPKNSMKRQKDRRTLKDELPRLVLAKYVIADQWKNNSRKNKETDSKQNNTQLWMWLVMEVKSNAVKSNIT